MSDVVQVQPTSARARASISQVSGAGTGATTGHPPKRKLAACSTRNLATAPEPCGCSARDLFPQRDPPVASGYGPRRWTRRRWSAGDVLTQRRIGMGACPWCRARRSVVDVDRGTHKRSPSVRRDQPSSIQLRPFRSQCRATTRMDAGPYVSGVPVCASGAHPRAHPRACTGVDMLRASSSRH